MLPRASTRPARITDSPRGSVGGGSARHREVLVVGGHERGTTSTKKPQVATSSRPGPREVVQRGGGFESRRPRPTPPQVTAGPLARRSSARMRVRPCVAFACQNVPRAGRPRRQEVVQRGGDGWVPTVRSALGPPVQVLGQCLDGTARERDGAFPGSGLGQRELVLAVDLRELFG